MHDALSALVTRRQQSMFSSDVTARHAEIAERISGKRILVIGGAGSIGSATVRATLPFKPSAVHIVDQSENSLAEFVRDLRSANDALPVRDFRALPLDCGSPVMARLIRDEGPYDLVMNFAAIKHVRSEKDIYSVMQMLDTNVLKCVRVLRWLDEQERSFRYFCVSTDKAANPVNLMGASKRLMEHLIFSGEPVGLTRAQASSARFANVAFSDGSLLHAFLLRLQKRQPLAVPRDTRRYFISLCEAGEICLLASACAPDRHILVPRLDPNDDLVLLQDIASLVLRQHGLTARYYEDEKTAKLRLSDDVRDGAYPVVLTPLDTSGEKPYEEFVGTGEQVRDIGMNSVLAVPCERPEPGSITRIVSRIEAAVSGVYRVSKDDLVTWLSEEIPQFTHSETGRSLDERM